MPASRESYELAQKQRREQLKVQRAFMAEYLLLWPLFTNAQTSEDRQKWLRLTTLLVKRWRGVSRPIALHYYDQAHRADLGTRAPRPPRIKEIPDETIIRNLLQRSAGTINRARLVGLGDLVAEERALAASLASAGRLVLGGGRDALEQAGAADRTAIGFMRVSDGDPCSFCALVISRGAVYKNAGTAGLDVNEKFAGAGMFKFHDHCGCTAGPVFTRNEFISDEAKKYREMYDEVKNDHKGADARNEMRRIIEGRRAARKRSTGSDKGDNTRHNPSRDVDADQSTASLKKTLAGLEQSAKKFTSPGIEKRIAELRRKIAARG